MRKFIKWAGLGVGVIVVLILLAGGVMYFIGSANVDRSYEVEAAQLDIPSDSASLAHGEHVLNINGCRDCHGQNLGGEVMIDAPPFRVVAANLTSGAGGLGGRYSAEDFDRAIRNGVRPNGRPVLIMPSAAFHNMSDEDAAAMIAYIQNLPPVDNELPPTEVRVPGRIMSAALMDPAFEVRTTRARAGAPEAGPTREYGEYLASITCAYCHGEDLRGAQPPIPDSPPAPDLAAAGQWPLDQFKATLRTGVRPSGEKIDEKHMPISFTKNMKESDLEALHAYLSTLGETASL